jgi:multidrug efflux pump subunit AcrB
VRKVVLFLGGGAVLVLAGAVGVWGWEQARNGADPSVAELHVQAAAPGLDPLRVEAAVTTVLEEGLRGVPGVAVVESTSAEGRADLTLGLVPGAAPEQVADTVRLRVGERLRLLPTGVHPPLVTLSPRHPHGWVWIPLEQADPTAVAREADRAYQVLQRAPGISEVGACGAPDLRVVVRADPRRMAQRGLSPSDVVRGLRTFLSGSSALGAAPPVDLDALLAGALREGVTVRDVASVTIESSHPCVATRAGRQGLLFAIRLAGRAQPLARAAGADELRARLEQQQLPAEVLGFAGHAVRLQLAPERALPPAELEALLGRDASDVVVESDAAGARAAVVALPAAADPAVAARALAVRLAQRVGTHVESSELDDVAVPVHVQADDLAVLADATERALAAARATDGVLVAWSEGTAVNTRTDLEVDRQAAARLGATVDELTMAARMLGEEGAELDRVTLRNAPATLCVRLDGAPGEVTVRTSSGRPMVLAELLRAESRSAPRVVLRRDGQRSSSVWVLPREGDRAAVEARLHEALARALPAGARLSR